LRENHVQACRFGLHQLRTALGLIAVSVDGLDQRRFPAAFGEHVRLLAGRNAHVRVVQLLCGGEPENAQALTQTSPGGKGKDLIRLFHHSGLKNEDDSGQRS
jgi:hypothetical protein